MLTDTAYELCLPILNDESAEEEEKTDRLEELLGKETNLKGKALQEAVLGALWRYRDSKTGGNVSPSARHIVRRGSPAPWQIPRATTPMTSPSLAGASPVSSHGFVPAGFARAKSSTASPFTSPRPSPRLAFTNPIPHSPNLNSYEFTEPPAHHADYGDLGSEGVDWLVGEAASSRPTSSGAGSSLESGLNAAATPWIQPTQTEMTPYDMLRSIMGETKTDAEIENALAANSYDLSATIAAMMNGDDDLADFSSSSPSDGQVLIGKSMQSSPASTGQSNPKSSVICKYWLATGTCLRADCRYGHEFGSTLCRYWMTGNCLAGDTCVFSHDPSQLVNDLSISNSVGSNPTIQSALQIQDVNSFPALQVGGGSNSWVSSQSNGLAISSNVPGLITRSLSNTSFTSVGSGIASTASPRSYSSHPTSRHSSRAPTPSIPQVDDTEAFPSLGSPATGKVGKKHHGKRGGHGHTNSAKDGSTSLLADVVRMNSTSNAPITLRKSLIKARSYRQETNSLGNSISSPEYIPWLEGGERANAAYLKARQDAFKHGGLRNKFLQSAAQAWNRNDARAAKALSLRGQSENDLMRKAHREAATALYEECNASEEVELYVDLHGLHPEEAVAHVEEILLDHQQSKRPIYVITGTSHHSKNGKDKVSKAVRQWLVEWKYTFREFSVPSDKSGNIGSILGIDPSNFDKSLLTRKEGSKEKNQRENNGLTIGETEILVNDTEQRLEGDDQSEAALKS